jgi:integrase
MRLRDSKTGERQVDLADAAQEAFRRIPRIRGNPYVFPNPRVRNEPMKDIIIFWRSTVLAKAGIKPLRCASMTSGIPSPATRRWKVRTPPPSPNCWGIG